MSEKPNPVAVTAADVPPRSKPSVYPEPFASRMAGREKRHDDLKAVLVGGAWMFVHKDGTPYW